MSYKIKPGGWRLPLMDTPEKFDAAEHLSEDMKEFGKRNLSMVPPTAGWLMLGANPDMQAFLQIWEREMTSMMEGDMQAAPFGFMNITNAVLALESGDEYAAGVMAACNAGAVVDYGYGYEGTVKMQMYGYPDCSCWNDDERLCIKFVHAFINYEMTDELFQEAIDAWGENMVVLRMCWICYVWSFDMIENALGMKYDIEKEIFPYGAWTPENVKMTVDNLAGSHLKVRDLWNNMNSFVSGEEEARAKAAAEKANK